MPLTNTQKSDIKAMRLQGMTYKEISQNLNIPLNTIKSFCRRQDISRAACKYCGKPLAYLPKCKKKTFCDNYCRQSWWKENYDKVNKNAVYHLVCANCNNPFDSYGNSNRKYCSRTCYIEDRYSPP